ncbi:MAG TPA: PRC-barrel domain-containing protein [Burkholderiales bacterium]|nr:PRC-barrel domain-containing protein [Burkholderiales bacterium]
MNQADFRNGISVNRLTGMDVRGQKGNQLGEVQDVIFSSDGKVQAITFKSGGFANVGDALFRVGWNELKFDNAMNRVTAPLTEQTVERYQERGQPRAVLVDTGAGPGGIRAVPFRANAFNAINNACARSGNAISSYRFRLSIIAA